MTIHSANNIYSGIKIKIYLVNVFIYAFLEP